MTEEFATDVVEGIIRDYVNIGLNIADTGTPDRLDTETWERCIYEIRHLHLSEPWLPAMTILNALQLAGWTPPDTAEPEGDE